MAAKYLTMVGQLQWLVTLGSFDIHAQVSTRMPFGLRIMQLGLELINLTIPFYLIQILIGHTVYMVMFKKAFLMTCQIHLARQ